jgi:hypothetical protein
VLTGTPAADASVVAPPSTFVRVRTPSALIEAYRYVEGPEELPLAAMTRPALLGDAGSVPCSVASTLEAGAPTLTTA